MDPLSFPAVLIYLTTYFVVERGIKEAYQLFYPEFFAQLYRDRKDQQYFVFIMGILLALMSTPICFSAFQESTSTNDLMGEPNLSTAGKMCMAFKAVLWTSEFNRLDHSVGYIKHHLGSIGYLVYHLYNNLPLRIVYAFYASLATELVSNAGKFYFLRLI
jgi:hypothetical protein